MSQIPDQPMQHNALAQLHAETWSENREFRRSLGKMMLRVLEKLEAEFTLGRTRHSTSSSLARELRATCEYLEGLQDRIQKQQGSQSVEAKLTQLNTLIGELQKLRLGTHLPKAIRTRVPGQAVSGSGIEEPEAQASPSDREAKVPLRASWPDAEVEVAPSDAEAKAALGGLKGKAMEPLEPVRRKRGRPRKQVQVVGGEGIGLEGGKDDVAKQGGV